MKGSDDELAGTTSDMEEAVNELSQAVGLATLKGVEIFDEIMQSMNGNVEFFVASTTWIDQRTGVIQSNTKAIIDQNEDLANKQDEATTMQRETLEIVTEQSRLLSSVIQHFGSVKMGENFGRNFQMSILKLDVVKLRLARWGQSVGLANLDKLQSVERTEIPPRDIPKVVEHLSQCLDYLENAATMSKKNSNSALLRFQC